MNIAISTKEFINKERRTIKVEEWFTSSSGIKYLKPGEIFTRFLKVNANSISSIREFVHFCDILYEIENSITSDRFYNRFKEEQYKVRCLIEVYNNINSVYNKDNFEEYMLPGTDKINSAMLEKLHTPTLRNIAKILGDNTKEVQHSFTTVYKHPTEYFMRSDPKNRKISKVHALQLFDMVPWYECNDIFSLVWIEIAHLIMLKRRFKLCSCQAFFIKVGANKKCFLCNEIKSTLSLKSQLELDPNQHLKKKTMDRVNRYIARNKTSSDKILHYLDTEVHKLDSIQDYELKKELEDYLSHKIEKHKHKRR